MYSEITTGMSAPPIGNVINTPSANAEMKNAMIHGTPSVVMAMMPSTTVSKAMQALKICMPGKV